MQQAMEAVNSRKMSYRQAAKQYSVPKTTLCRKVKKSLLNLGTNNTKKNMGRFKNVLSGCARRGVEEAYKTYGRCFLRFNHHRYLFLNFRILFKK